MNTMNAISINANIIFLVNAVPTNSKFKIKSDNYR